MKTAFQRFLRDVCPKELLRKLYPNPQWLDADPSDIHSASCDMDVQGFLWRRLADAGLLRTPVPAPRGDPGAPLEQLISWLEETGRVLLPAPYLADVILGAMTLAAGRGAASFRLLRRFEKGSARLTLAIDGSWTDPDRLPVKFTARRKAGGHVLSGAVLSLLDPQADYFLVPAFHAGGKSLLSIFLVSRHHPGVSLHDQAGLDRTRPIARLSLRNTQVSSNQIIGPAGRAEHLIEKALLRCLIGLSAEMVGGASHILETSLAYARERRLAGRPIASFQSVAHRLADLHARIELTRPLVQWAARLSARRSSDARAAASMAKAAAGDLSLDAAETGLRIHGARGVTWDHWLHPYHRRALLNRQLFGSPDFHREMVARHVLSVDGNGKPWTLMGKSHKLDSIKYEP